MEGEAVENDGNTAVMGDFSIFNGKKFLMFTALEYHNRILLPVKAALESHGATVEAATVQAEAAFEINCNRAGLPYRHVNNFIDDETARRVNIAYQQIADRYSNLYLEQNSILQNVPCVIWDKIVRAVVECYYGFERMIDVLKPDAFMALTETNSWGKMIGYLCQKKGIPYFTWQEGLCYSAVPMYRFHTVYSDACMVWGQGDKDVLIAADNDESRLPIVGNIDLAETIARVTNPQAIKEVKEAHGIPPENDLLLFLMSHASYGHLQDTPFIHWLFYHPNVTVVFKFHPIQQKPLVEAAMATFGQIPNVKIVITGDTYGLLAAARACVVVGATTTGIEALAFNKPLVEVPLPDSTYSYAAKGACPTASSLSEASTLVWELANIPNIEWRRKGEDYLRHHFYGWEKGKFDGRTVGRVLEVMANVMGKKHGE